MADSESRRTASDASPGVSRAAETNDNAFKRLSALARLLDARFGIPGTRWQFGLDSLVGLVPGLGDAATAALSGYIILEARRLGASRVTMFRMIWNVILDLAVGAIPFLGDLFDFYWKANIKNIELLRRDLVRKRRD